MATDNEEQLEISLCPIWRDFSAGGSIYPDEGIIEVDSPRAGEGYTISVEAADLLKQTLSFRLRGEQEQATSFPTIDQDNRIKLTSWLIDQFLLGNRYPCVTSDVIASMRSRGRLPAWERANRLLRFIAKETPELGTIIEFDRHVGPSNAGGARRETTLRAFGWSESNRWIELEFLMDYLVNKGWLENLEQLGLPTLYYRVTVDGHSEIGRSENITVSDQAFVAMWFDKSMNEAYREGIAPAIKEAGYEPVIINRVEHIGLIDDAIVAAIRKSRFIVADFTQGDDGPRGGVYYEAGLAHGREIPVIFTCRKDKFDLVHFDTSHFSHIVWTDYKDLRNQLKNRIEAVIGRGPVEFQDDEEGNDPRP